MAFRAGKCLLRRRLREARMTQVQLAERTNLSTQMISHYATNRKFMNLAAAKTIADVLGICIDDLYEWEHVRNTDE